MYSRFLLLLVSMFLLFSENAWGCLTDAALPRDQDMKYPSDHTIAFKGVIEKISSHGDLDQGKPHGGFQLKLKITKVFQGVNLGNSILINYGGCHNLPGKQGDVINVLALHDKKDGWYAPDFWTRSNDPRNKDRPSSCKKGTIVYGTIFSDRTIHSDRNGDAFMCIDKGKLIPLGYDPRKLKK